MEKEEKRNIEDIDWKTDYFTGEELLKMETPEIDPLRSSLDNLLPENQGMILFGPSSPETPVGSSKTTAKAIARITALFLISVPP